MLIELTDLEVKNLLNALYCDVQFEDDKSERSKPLLSLIDKIERKKNEQ